MLMTDKSNKKSFIGGWTETHHELTSESRLWKHVICQAISDSYLGNKRQKLAVGQWIVSDDFIMVCDLSSLNSDRMEKLIKEILTSKPVVARYLGEKLRKVIQNKTCSM